MGAGDRYVCPGGFPGLFPDLTRYQAEMDQRSVNDGQESWKNDPAKVASSLVATFFGWTQQVMTKVLSGGGPRDVDATVQVQNILMQNQGPTVIVDAQSSWRVRRRTCGLPSA